MQYFFQDMHSFPLDKSTAKNSWSLFTETMKVWAKTFKFAIAILLQFNNFGAKTWNKVLTSAEFCIKYNYQQQDHIELLFVGLYIVSFFLI